MKTWKPEDINEARQRAYAADEEQRGLSDTAVAAIMSKALEVAAVEGGTMTAANLVAALRGLEIGGFGTHSSLIREHTTAQGITISTLREEADLLRSTLLLLWKEPSSVDTFTPKSAARARIAALLQAEREREAAMVEAKAQRERVEVLEQQLAKDVAHWAERASLAEQSLASLERTQSVLASQAMPACTCSAGPSACIASEHPCSSTCIHPDRLSTGHRQRIEGLIAALVAEPNGAVLTQKPVPWKDSSSQIYNAGWRDAVTAVEARVRKALENTSAEVLSAIEGAAP